MDDEQNQANNRTQAQIRMSRSQVVQTNQSTTQYDDCSSGICFCFSLYSNGLSKWDDSFLLTLFSMPHYHGNLSMWWIPIEMLKLNIENVVKLVFNVNLKSVRHLRIVSLKSFVIFVLSMSILSRVLSWIVCSRNFVMWSIITMKYRCPIGRNAKREYIDSLRSVRRLSTRCCYLLWISFDLLDIREKRLTEFYCEIFL